MLTDVDACDCTRGLYEHRKRVCTESRLWEKLKNPCRSGESNPRQYCAWPIGPTLFHFPAPLLKFVSDTCPRSSVEPQYSPPSLYFLLDSNPLPQSHLKFSSCYSISTSSKYHMEGNDIKQYFLQLNVKISVFKRSYYFTFDKHNGCNWGKLRLMLMNS